MTSQDPTSTDPTPTSPAAAGEDGTSGSDHVMDMLGEHVPLSLLMDLTSPKGPDSETILDDEGLPESTWWDDADGGADGPDGSGREDATSAASS